MEDFVTLGDGFVTLTGGFCYLNAGSRGPYLANRDRVLQTVNLIWKGNWCAFPGLCFGATVWLKNPQVH